MENFPALIEITICQGWSWSVGLLLAGSCLVQNLPQEVFIIVIVNIVDSH